MRKLLSLLLVIAMMLSLLGCDMQIEPDNTVPQKETDPTGNTGGNDCQHAPEVIRTTDSTCAEPGSVVSACRLCGKEFTEVVPATGHSFSDPTCTQAKGCSVCGVTEGDALGHNYVSGKCERCGSEMAGHEEKPAGCNHEYNLSAQKAPTCTVAGSFTYTCDQCGDTYTDTVAAKGHVYTDATCDAPKTCRVCNATEGSALGHSYADGTCTRCGTADPSVPTEVTYKVTIRSDKGALVEGVTVSVYTTGTTPAAVSKTNSKGVATMTLMSADSYKIVLTDVPSDLSAKESYTFRSITVNINLATVSQITPTDHSKANYKAGSIMGDFTLTDTDGNSYNLSELLKEKELVILNFWFVNCGPCKAEFPYFEAAYKKYADNVQLLTMNHFDTESQIKELRQQMGVSFPMIKENIGFQQGFGITAYPTTVFINSSGKILKIKVGEFKDQTELDEMIEGFL